LSKKYYVLIWTPSSNGIYLMYHIYVCAWKPLTQYLLDDMVLTSIYKFLNINTIFQKFYLHVSDTMVNCFHTWLSWYCKHIVIPWCAHTFSVLSLSESNWPDYGSIGTETCCFCTLINYMYHLCFNGVYYSLYYLSTHIPQAQSNINIFSITRLWAFQHYHLSRMRLSASCPLSILEGHPLISGCTPLGRCSNA
jgi:hypothetical protein